MLLKDLNLSVLPLDVLVVLKNAIREEIRARKHAAYVERKSLPFRPPLHVDFWDKPTKKIIDENSRSLYSLPLSVRQGCFRNRIRYLPSVLQQDWNFLFPSANTSDHNFYVYAHVDPRPGPTKLHGLNTCLRGAPFYIGKGSGSRAFDLKRNQGHGKRIKLIRDAGFVDSLIPHVIQNSLTELQSLVLEAKLIYFFGSIYDETINGCLLNLADHIKPKFVKDMAKLLKRVKTPSEVQKDEPTQVSNAEVLL